MTRFCVPTQHYPCVHLYGRVKSFAVVELYDIWPPNLNKKFVRETLDPFEQQSERQIRSETNVRQKIYLSIYQCILFATHHVNQSLQYHIAWWWW